MRNPLTGEPYPLELDGWRAGDACTTTFDRKHVRTISCVYVVAGRHRAITWWESDDNVRPEYPWRAVEQPVDLDKLVRWVPAPVEQLGLFA